MEPSGPAPALSSPRPPQDRRLPGLVPCPAGGRCTGLLLRCTEHRGTAGLDPCPALPSRAPRTLSRPFPRAGSTLAHPDCPFPRPAAGFPPANSAPPKGLWLPRENCPRSPQTSASSRELWLPSTQHLALTPRPARGQTLPQVGYASQAGRTKLGKLPCTQPEPSPEQGPGLGLRGDVSGTAPGLGDPDNTPRREAEAAWQERCPSGFPPPPSLRHALCPRCVGPARLGHLRETKAGKARRMFLQRQPCSAGAAPGLSTFPSGVPAGAEQRAPLRRASQLHWAPGP